MLRTRKRLMITPKEAKNKIKSFITKSKNRPAKSHLSDKDLQELIASKAYELYVNRGCKQGDPMADWIEAERLVKR